MSRASLEKFLLRFDKEPALQQRLKETADTAFEEFSLDPEERRVIQEVDLATLYEWGVHPLLIRNFGATMGVRYVDAYAERGIKR